MAQDFRTGLKVDISRFTGSWYELARTPNRFQDATRTQGGQVYSPCYNVKTEFAMQSPGKLSLRSFCSRQSQQGDEIQDILGGLATITGEAANRKFKIALGSATVRALQRLFTGGGKNYWIYCLGPVNEKGRYDWAVTGGPKRRFVFLLTRDRAVPDRTRSEILACARREGIPVDRLNYLQR